MPTHLNSGHSAAAPFSEIRFRAVCVCVCVCVCVPCHAVCLCCFCVVHVFASLSW